MTSPVECMEFHATRQKIKDFELFSFPIEGKKIFDIAAVSHIKKGDDGEIEGFQRPEVRKHISNIKEYIEKPISMIPNAIVLGIEDPEFSFTKIDSKSDAFGEVGILKIPIHVNSETRACLIIDGQQRSKAIEKAEVSTFPIMVCAFYTDDEEVMKEHFYNVNSSKSLPNDLIASLIQGIPMQNLIESMRPAHMAATLVGELSKDLKSPFYGMINSAIYKDGVISIGSIKKPLEILINDKTNFIGMNTGSGGIMDKEKILEKIYNYWEAVSQVFNHAWGEKIKVSKLMHGVGLWAMFHLMPKLLDKCSNDPEVDEIKTHLNLIAQHCHWTEEDGDWENIDGFGLTLPWNGFENTAKGKGLLTGFILRTYITEFQRAKL